MTEGQKASLNVDFEAKMQSEWQELERDRDESRSVPVKPEESSSEEEESDEDDDAEPAWHQVSFPLLSFLCSEG